MNTNKATISQASLIYLEAGEIYDTYPILAAIYKAKYPLGFQQAIVDTLTKAQADYIIKAFKKVKGYKLAKALNILITLKQTYDKK